MGCILAGVAFFFPRLTIILLVIFGDYIGRAFDTFIWPFLGFFFMPYTVLAYAVGKNTGTASVQGWEIAIIVVAVLLDFGVIGGGADATRRKRLGSVKAAQGL